MFISFCCFMGIRAPEGGLQQFGKSVRLESLVTMEGWVTLPVKSHWTMNNLAIFCRTAKSSGWLENNFLRSSLNSSCLTAAEQHAYCSGGKINFWSHLCEERPEKPQNFHRNPSCGRIESIKSAGKRSEKVILITCPRHFPETLLSCRIYVPKNAILQVNPSETSLVLLLVFSVCTANPTCGDIFESSKLKARTSLLPFQWKETFELWALSFKTAFENDTPSWIGCSFFPILGCESITFRSHTFFTIFVRSLFF